MLAGLTRCAFTVLVGGGGEFSSFSVLVGGGEFSSFSASKTTIVDRLS
jgi:hypothetical protein